MSGVSVTLSGLAAQTVSEGNVPFAIDGPVGIAAVALGAAGLVLGLLRRRRVAIAAVKAKALPLPAPRTPQLADERSPG